MLMMMIGMMVMMTSCMLHCISLARAACLDAIQLLQNVLSSHHGLSVLLVHYVWPNGQGGHDNGHYLYYLSSAWFETLSWWSLPPLLVVKEWSGKMFLNLVLVVQLNNVAILYRMRLLFELWVVVMSTLGCCHVLFDCCQWILVQKIVAFCYWNIASIAVTLYSTWI